MTFAIALLPIIGFIGAAVDYSRVSAARSGMQTALDTAALMVSKDNATGSLSASALTAKAQAYFTALYNRSDVNNVSISATYSNSSAGSSIAMTGSGKLPTSFLAAVGFPNLAFNVGSTTSWGNTKMRVALALDVTGSMATAGKLTAMQGAAKTLIDQLSASAQNAGDVYISLVPFAKVVNVGAGNFNATWLDWTDWDNANQNCTGSWWNYSCSSKPHPQWTGCVTDRDQNYDTTNTAPTSSATRFPTIEYYSNGQYYCKPNNSVILQQITPLTYDWSGLKTKIDALQPTGGTNQAIGLAWAWMSLSQTAPLNAPALDSGYTYKQAVIILSDGQNTEDRWYGDGTTYASQVDARQRIICDNMKAAGLTIYTIQVNTDSDPQSAVLAYCASSTDNFFYLTSADQVLAAFSSIGNSLMKLRVSK